MKNFKLFLLISIIVSSFSVKNTSAFVGKKQIKYIANLNNILMITDQLLEYVPSINKHKNYPKINHNLLIPKYKYIFDKELHHSLNILLLFNNVLKSSIDKNEGFIPIVIQSIILIKHLNELHKNSSLPHETKQTLKELSIFTAQKTCEVITNYNLNKKFKNKSVLKSFLKIILFSGFEAAKCRAFEEILDSNINKNLPNYLQGAMIKAAETFIIELAGNLLKGVLVSSPKIEDELRKKHEKILANHAQFLKNFQTEQEIYKINQI